jgi:hypothetical protein
MKIRYTKEQIIGVLCHQGSFAYHCAASARSDEQTEIAIHFIRLEACWIGDQRMNPLDEMEYTLEVLAGASEQKALRRPLRRSRSFGSNSRPFSEQIRVSSQRRFQFLKH